MFIPGYIMVTILLYQLQERGSSINITWKIPCTGELGYDGPLYDRFLHMTDHMLGPSPMHIKYLSYVYDRFCI